jgi:hypothetical protein
MQRSARYEVFTTIQVPGDPVCFRCGDRGNLAGELGHGFEFFTTPGALAGKKDRKLRSSSINRRVGLTPDFVTLKL